MRGKLIKQFYFEAAHQNKPAGGARARLHGHSYRLDVEVEGAVDDTMGWIVDFGDIKRAFGPLHQQLDHNTLNAIDGIGAVDLPGVQAWVLENLGPRVPGLSRVTLTLRGDLAFKPIFLFPNRACGLPGRIAFGFEAAHHLPRTPMHHKCHRMHGHSYRIEVGAEEPDTVLSALRELYEALDHSCLNELPGLENATSENLAGWIWERLAPRTPGLRTIVIHETCTSSCIYCGE